MDRYEMAALIQNRRKELAINQEDLSEMTQVTSRTIYAIERGKGNPSIETLQKILTVLGLEISIGIKKISV